jgi:hypothetical protein
VTAAAMPIHSSKSSAVNGDPLALPVDRLEHEMQTIWS